MAPKKNRRRKRRGSSNAGRPPLPGARQPCGRLKYLPPTPNARVIAERRAALGDASAGLETADSPLDLAHARGWITERQHRAGAAFVRIRQAASLGAPGYSGGGLEEAPEERTRDKRPLRELSNAEILAAWDSAVPLPIPADNLIRSANALMTWKAICAAVPAAELEEVQLVCVYASWPQWVVHRCAGHFETSWERKHVLLTAGLDKVAAVVFTGAAAEVWAPPEEPKAVAAALVGGKALNRKSGPKSDDVTVYVDEAGAVLREVVRKVRR